MHDARGAIPGTTSIGRKSMTCSRDSSVMSSRDVLCVRLRLAKWAACSSVARHHCRLAEPCPPREIDPRGSLAPAPRPAVFFELPSSCSHSAAEHSESGLAVAACRQRSGRPRVRRRHGRADPGVRGRRRPGRPHRTHYAPGDAVLPENFGGARALAAALAEMGHRLIGVISGPPQLTTTFGRLAGFRRGLEEAGMS